MRHAYLLPLIALGLTAGQRASAQTAPATAWRPFRPGFVYGFAPASTSPTYPLHTLRVDSAYATAAGDSVYAFNRLLRLVNAPVQSHAKSRNNIFGARLRWAPGTRTYYLETNAEPTTTGQAATVLLLRPTAPVGSTWTACSQPALTATLTGRYLSSIVTGIVDSVTTITLSNGQELVCSKYNGLLRGPRWLDLTAPPVVPWQQPAPPQTGLGAYDPQALFALNAGDELGYEIISGGFSGSLVCSMGYRLRRITGRQLTADSLVLTYREQTRMTTAASSPFCPGGSGSTYTTSVQAGRWALSRRTGQSPQFPFLALLYGEYRPKSAGSSYLFMGRGLFVDYSNSSPTNQTCYFSTVSLPFRPMYPVSGQVSTPILYNPGVDAAAYQYSFSASLQAGPIEEGSNYMTTNNLTYYRRNGVTCGNAANFATLLPTRAADRAAETATLFPNPAPAEAATLALKAPARPGTTLVLLDAQGRLVWSAPAATGQTALPVPLAGQAPGLYLLRLLSPGGSAASWPLEH